MVLAAAIAVVLMVVAVATIPRLLSDRGRQEANTVPEPSPSAAPDRTLPPVVDGRVLPLMSAEAQPPAPTQWAGGAGPIRSNSWWSSAVTGPGATSLWPQPLALSIGADGVVQVAAPEPTAQANGTIEAPLLPAIFIEPDGPATTKVTGSGSLHVSLRLEPASPRQPIDLTLVQGSPLVELATSGPLTFRVPGLRPTAETNGAQPSLLFETAVGGWIIATDGAATITTAEDRILVDPSGRTHLVIGPVPAGATTSYADRATAIAQHPVESSKEQIEVDDFGVTTQTLSVNRAGVSGDESPTLWALQPHQQKYGTDLPQSLGTVSSALGPAPVVAVPRLQMAFPAVPILWSAVPLPGSMAPAAAGPTPVEGTGSYFGGKAVYARAARAAALRGAGDGAGEAEALASAIEMLDQLTAPEQQPLVRWDQQWGSAVIEPAEFGSGTELNDHQLQYGYWVAAASQVVEQDPARQEPLQATIDLLVADYAGAAAVPGISTSLPAERAWSPYEGHSWASGTAPFAAGNNLESSSESSFSWWAAARWFMTTGRPDLAETFIGRFTIETALTATRWLPAGDQLPEDPARRPWSGVVWSGKTDPNTWFDPNDESALGIQLLPVGPSSLARYGTEETRAAARARWAWCEKFGNGCGVRWSNLLDSDAAVAGLPLQAGPDPEPSVDPILAAWWRSLWEQTEALPDWSCTPGAIARRTLGGTIVVLAAPAGSAAVTLSCRDETGATRWSSSIDTPTAEILR